MFHMKQNRTEKQEVGILGENIYEKQVVKHGYNVIGRNYRKPWGEIDIIAKKDSVLHFIEVKAVGHALRAGDDYEPEDNVHSWKLKRLSRAIQSYMLENDISEEISWQVDVAA